MPTEIDIYAGRDPRDAVAYTLRDAAYYARVSPTTLQTWLRGRSFPSTTGTRRVKEVIRPARSGPVGLSFFNMIEIHVLRAIRTVHGVPLQQVRPALAWIEKEMALPHPLAQAHFRTAGRSIFVERFGKVIHATKSQVVEIHDAVAATLDRVEYATDGLAESMSLWARDITESRTIEINPRVAFGKAVVTGTRVPIRVLADFHNAGDSIEELARIYSLREEQVRSAVRWGPSAKAA